MLTDKTLAVKIENKNGAVIGTFGAALQKAMGVEISTLKHDARGVTVK